VRCGALNLEQSKLVSSGDLRLLLGDGLLGTPDHQRGKLDELARDDGLPAEILRWNFQRLGGGGMADFFYDPHTKHYTGGQNVLKGWCARIRWADKVIGISTGLLGMLADDGLKGRLSFFGTTCLKHHSGTVSFGLRMDEDS
jgi:hypothetical protein